MKKIISIAAMTVFSGLLLSGCATTPSDNTPSAEETSSSSVTDTAGPTEKLETPVAPGAPGVPDAPAATQPGPEVKPDNQNAPPAPQGKPAGQPARPDEAQSASLMQELQKIDPAISSPQTIDEAQRACRIILRDGPEKVQISLAKRLLKGPGISEGPAAEEAAKKVIEVIKNNGFCKPAA